MSDEMHKLFNEAHSATDALAYKLSERGYEDLAQIIRNSASHIDAAHHDYTELILDPS